jgi:hypothetical protein
VVQQGGRATADVRHVRKRRPQQHYWTAVQELRLIVSRTINLNRIREGLSMQWRAELYKAFNHPNFSQPAQNVDTPSFGQITNALDPRQMQFGLKIKF